MNSAPYRQVRYKLSLYGNSTPIDLKTGVKHSIQTLEKESQPMISQKDLQHSKHFGPIIGDRRHFWQIN